MYAILKTILSSGVIRMIKLLLVEDEKRMNEALAELLRQEGYAVDAMSNGADGMTAIVENAYDLAVLDVMLPGASGFDIAVAARSAGITMPILMLTAKSSLEDKITGLDSGADDYLTKPFEPRELLARLLKKGANDTKTTCSVLPRRTRVTGAYGCYRRWKKTLRHLNLFSPNKE